MKKTVIVNGFRTAIGSFMGGLSSLKATELGKIVIEKVINDSGIDVSIIDEVIMGNVLPAGLGQAPARQSAIYAGLPEKTECLTINKMCGSGLKAVMLAQQAIATGDADVIIAGGMESMSNSPYLLPKARTGYKMGNGEIIDSLIYDGLWDIYNNIHMGSCAEKCAEDFNFSREVIDEYAILSYKRTLKAQENGIFENEIVPVIIKNRNGDIEFKIDEDPEKVKFDKIPSLKPVFKKDGVVTAANASNINDGAAALLVMSEEKAIELGLNPIAEIIAQASAAKAPIDFTTAPVDAINKVLKKANLSTNDIGLYEINEAFSVVALAAIESLKLNIENVNVNGGAIALGHPIGASGARILVTLLNEMQRRNTEFGLASLCIGGGEASALIVRNLRS